MSKITENKLMRKSAPGGQAKILNIPRNWIHQALFYMDRTEFWFRLVIEGIGFLCSVFLLSLFFQSKASDWMVIAVSFALIHTLNWILNGNWWALMMFTFPGIRNAGEKATCEYLAKMANRLRTNQSIAALVVYGSAARGQWHNKSDLDLRILREKGFLNGFTAAVITMRERAIAFFSVQPTDLFLADDAKFLSKMRKDENPIILLKRGPLAEQVFSGDEEILNDSWPTR